MEKAMFIALTLVMGAALVLPGAAASFEAGSVPAGVVGPFCFALSPWPDIIDPLYADNSVSPAVVYGHMYLLDLYNSPILGITAGRPLVMTVDWPGPENPNFYAMGFFNMKTSTLDGSMYRTLNGDDYIPPSYVQLVACGGATTQGATSAAAV